MSEQNVIKIKMSFRRKIVVLMCCAAVAYVLHSFLGPYTMWEAMTHGKLIGKVAFATFIFMVLTAGIFVLTIYDPRYVKLDQFGITEGGFRKSTTVGWHDVLDVTTSSSGVIIDTPTGPVVIGKHLPYTKKIFAKITEYRSGQTSSRQYGQGQPLRFNQAGRQPRTSFGTKH